MKLYRLLLLLCFFLPKGINAQTDSVSKIKKQAEDYYENGRYDKALYFFNKYKRVKEPDAQMLTKMAVSSYHVNDMNASIQLLRDLEGREKNVNDEVYLYTAKVLQSQNRFSDAVKYYKKFLAKSKSNGDQRRQVRDEIRRCAVGMKLKMVKDIALVENLGQNINTTFDEYAPVQSPNYGSKIYFSSARSGSKGGLRNSQGLKDNEYGAYNSDMYFTVQDQGAWTEAEPMAGTLNTNKSERLIDFNLDGSVLYFYKGSDREGKIYVDTFSNDEEDVKFPAVYQTNINASKGDKTAYFYNDSLVIFSSFRKGGFGGFDLYAMVKQNDEWMTPFNLGPKINSAYDEISPFLSHNGRVLFFSSNNSRKSCGGYDVFSAEYDDLINEWKDAQNLGLSINSSEDDTYFRLTKDGKRAYFSSKRKSGFGGNDLYVAYFKSDRAEQVNVSFPLTFIQLENIEERLALANNAGSLQKSQGVGNPTEEPVSEEKVVNIKTIYFDDDRDVLNTENKKKIAVATELMKRYPQSKLLLYSHSDQEGSTLPFNMYFSIKRAEKVAEDMVVSGIEASRIVVMGLGPLYPVALNEINEAPNPMGRKLNRRIEFRFVDLQDEELTLEYESPNVSKFQAVEKGNYFKKSTKNLFYKIQIASTSQMFDDQILDTQPDPMVEKRVDKNKYHYTVGLYRSFSSALQFQKQLKKSGLTTSKIIPYIEGYRVPKYKIESYIESYPDLAKYLDHISEY